MRSDRAILRFVDTDFDIDQLSHPAWEGCGKVSICTYWNAETAPSSSHFTARALWSNEYLYARFDTQVGDGLVINKKPQTGRKTIGLWERDVSEIFIAPDRNEPRRYFEFEVAPTGEWLDLAIDTRNGDRITDWGYRSGVKTAALIDEGRVQMAMKIPWEAFGRKPKAGEIWLGNICRCVGREPDRGYLAWNPTMTETPNFHVPARFGELIFDN